MSYDKRALPLPPRELTRMVGHEDAALFDNPDGADQFPGLDSTSVLDLGCGCGRVARRLLQQASPPERYLGIDLNRPMVAWCKDNLRVLPGWDFQYVDVHNPGLNPRGLRKRAPVPAEACSFSLAVAWSLFTHVIEDEVEFNLREIARCLRPGGHLVSTWFLFDKNVYPFLQEFQNSLYCNLLDPTNAVVYGSEFVRALFKRCGLTIVEARPPAVRGFQWELVASKSDGEHAAFPPDTAPINIMRPPV